MTTNEERHSFIVPGISREAFQDIAVARTLENTSLAWYLHQHSHDPYGGIDCNFGCQVVRLGKVEHVTQMEDANSSSHG